MVPKIFVPATSNKIINAAYFNASFPFEKKQLRFKAKLSPASKATEEKKTLLGGIQFLSRMKSDKNLSFR